MDNKKKFEIKNAHKQYITNFRHYLYNINKTDLIISISAQDNNIKLWELNNYECLLNIQNIRKDMYLYSSCFLNDNNQLYILTSNFTYSLPEPIKLYNLQGNIIKEIKESSDKVHFIDTYYDKELSNYYIITGNQGYVKSYNYNKNELYYKYSDNNHNGHTSIVINDKDIIIKLIESSWDKNIRIWDFHSGNLLNKIKINDELTGICLWDNDHLYVGCNNKSIKIVDMKNNLIINSILAHDSQITTIKKICHPKYGECLLSQGLKEENIKLWFK